MTQKSSSFPGTSTASQGSPSKTTRDEAVDALKDRVTGEAKELTDEMKHIAGDVAGQARNSAEVQLSSGKDRVARGLDDVAEALRHSGEHLRGKDEAGISQYVDRAAEQVEVVSGYLQNRTVGQIVGDVEQFGRREPALFLGGAFVLGLLGGRFLKSSRPGRQRAALNSPRGAEVRYRGPRNPKFLGQGKSGGTGVADDAAGVPAEKGPAV
jgi:hypothetical protein